ncbi:F169A protein, partial [Atractosteus spatula]|nr:F169A protein [Atractosteus spatula]
LRLGRGPFPAHTHELLLLPRPGSPSWVSRSVSARTSRNGLDCAARGAPDLTASRSALSVHTRTPTQIGQLTNLRGRQPGGRETGRGTAPRGSRLCPLRRVLTSVMWAGIKGAGAGGRAGQLPPLSSPSLRTSAALQQLIFAEPESAGRAGSTSSAPHSGSGPPGPQPKLVVLFPLANPDSSPGWTWVCPQAEDTDERMNYTSELPCRRTVASQHVKDRDVEAGEAGLPVRRRAGGGDRESAGITPEPARGPASRAQPRRPLKGAVTWREPMRTGGELLPCWCAASPPPPADPRTASRASPTPGAACACSLLSRTFRTIYKQTAGPYCNRGAVGKAQGQEAGRSPSTAQGVTPRHSGRNTPGREARCGQGQRQQVSHHSRVPGRETPREARQVSLRQVWRAGQIAPGPPARCPPHRANALSQVRSAQTADRRSGGTQELCSLRGSMISPCVKPASSDSKSKNAGSVPPTPTKATEEPRVRPPDRAEPAPGPAPAQEATGAEPQPAQLLCSGSTRQASTPSHPPIKSKTKEHQGVRRGATEPPTSAVPSEFRPRPARRARDRGALQNPSYPSQRKNASGIYLSQPDCGNKSVPIGKRQGSWAEAQIKQFRGKAYPVDRLSDVSYQTLKITSEEVLSRLKSNSASETEWLVLPEGLTVKIDQSNVSRLSLFGDDDPAHAVLALLRPENKTQVLALYLDGTWWPLDDVLKTSDPSRAGLVTVSLTLSSAVVLKLFGPSTTPNPTKASKYHLQVIIS